MRCVFKESKSYSAPAYLVEGSTQNEAALINCHECSGEHHSAGHRYGYSIISTSNVSLCPTNCGFCGYRPWNGPRFLISYLTYWSNTGQFIHSQYNLNDEEMTSERVCTTNSTVTGLLVFEVASKYPSSRNVMFWRGQCRLDTCLVEVL